MTTEESTHTEKQSVEEIEAEIEATRNELGATVDELSHRLDVKGRAQDKASEVKAQVQEKAADVGDQVSSQAQHAKVTVLDRTESVRAMASAHPRETRIAAGGAVALLGAALMRRRRG